MQDAPKAVWSIPYDSVAFFPSLKQNFIADRSSKVSSRPDCIYEIHKLWQSGFSRVYSNWCCNCWFEPEIIKIGRSSQKMYSNNRVNFHESTTILNAHTKNVWKLIVCPSYIYTFESMLQKQRERERERKKERKKERKRIVFICYEKELTANVKIVGLSTQALIDKTFPLG